MINQRSIPLESPTDWRKALDGIKHAFAHTWENCHAMHLTTGFKTYLYCFQAENVRIVCPIAERSFERHLDIVTPYGYSGFVGTGDYPDFPKYWGEFVRGRRYVCGYIGLNPIFENKTYFEIDDLYSYNNIYVLDLGLSSEQLFSKISKNRRRDLEHWQRTSGHIVTDKDAVKAFFLANHSQFFHHKRATSAYDFGTATLESLFASDNVVVLGAARGNSVEAATMFTFTPDIADALLHVSLADERQHSAALLWHGANYLKSLGIPWLNLGGGVRGNDSLAWFKERFGGIKMPLDCLKQIYDRDVYASLCARAGSDPTNLAGYFPGYHALQSG
jgi:hypothetical protein